MGLGSIFLTKSSPEKRDAENTWCWMCYAVKGNFFMGGNNSVKFVFTYNVKQIFPCSSCLWSRVFFWQPLIGVCNATECIFTLPVNLCLFPSVSSLKSVSSLIAWESINWMIGCYRTLSSSLTAWEIAILHPVWTLNNCNAAYIFLVNACFCLLGTKY